MPSLQRLHLDYSGIGFLNQQPTPCFFRVLIMTHYQKHRIKYYDRRAKIAADRLDEWKAQYLEVVQRFLRFETIYEGDENIIRVWKIRFANYLKYKNIDISNHYKFRKVCQL